MTDKERLNLIKEVINSYVGTVKVIIHKPDELIEDVNWLIETIERQQQTIDALDRVIGDWENLFYRTVELSEHYEKTLKRNMEVNKNEV